MPTTSGRPCKGFKEFKGLANQDDESEWPVCLVDLNGISVLELAMLTFHLL